MIVTRLALPVRSPMPLIVPCTCVAPASTADQRVGDRAAGVVVRVDPQRHLRQRSRATSATTSRMLRGQRAAVGVAQHHPLGARVGGGAQAVERVPASSAKPSKKCSASNSTRLPCAHEEGDRLGDHAQVLLAARRARPSRRAAPRSCRRACRPARSSRRASAAPRPARRRVAAAGHAEGDDLATSAGARRRAARTARCSFGLDDGKPASIRWMPSVVERVHDAQLLLGREATCRRPPCRRAGWRRRAVCRPSA